MKHKSYLLAGLGLGLVMLVLEMGTTRTAVGQQTGGLPSLEQRVAALEAQMQSLNVDGLKADVAALKTKVSDLQTTVSGQADQIAALQSALAQEVSDRKAAVDPLADLLQPFSRTGTEVYLTGANLHIVNGLGNTKQVNGLGNLIVGYNALRGGNDLRTGSHNLIVGDYQNYTAYGGFVAGKVNTISGPYSTVVGGSGNQCSGSTACISGGALNQATGDSACVTAGWANTASGSFSSVTGGINNVADGVTASVSGGSLCRASGDTTSISGGWNIAQSARFGWSAGSQSTDAISGRFSSP